MEKFQGRYRIPSNRMPGWDYSGHGMYFITLCVEGKECVFGFIDKKKMMLNDYGQIAAEEWIKSQTMRREIELDVFVIMPNHVHGIVVLHPTFIGSIGDDCDGLSGHGDVQGHGTYGRGDMHGRVTHGHVETHGRASLRANGNRRANINERTHGNERADDNEHVDDNGRADDNERAPQTHVPHNRKYTPNTHATHKTSNNKQATINRPAMKPNVSMRCMSPIDKNMVFQEGY